MRQSLQTFLIQVSRALGRHPAGSKAKSGTTPGMKINLSPELGSIQNMETGIEEDGMNWRSLEIEKEKG